MIDLIIASAANWTLEPASYVKDTLYWCSNSVVHCYKVQDGVFTWTKTIKPKGKGVRCVSCYGERVECSDVVSARYSVTDKDVTAVRKGVLGYADGLVKTPDWQVRIESKVTAM